MRRKANVPGGNRDAAGSVLADCVRHDSALHDRESKAQSLSGAGRDYHVIHVERRRQFIFILEDVITAIVALGHIRKRDGDLIYDGKVMTPRALRDYLSVHCVFMNGKRLRNGPPLPIAYAVLSWAHSGQVPVRDEEVSS